MVDFEEGTLLYWVYARWSHGHVHVFPKLCWIIIERRRNDWTPFLCHQIVGDEAAPGNYGMFDQVEALKWVQRNIAGNVKNKTSIHF